MEIQKEIATEKIGPGETLAEELVVESTEYSVFDQVVYLLFGSISGILLIRFILKFGGANPATGIVRFFYNLSEPLMAPYLYILPTKQIGDSVLEWSVIVAILFYLIIAWILMKLEKAFFTADIADGLWTQ